MLWMSCRGVLGALLHLGMQSSLSSREVQLQVLLFTFMSCERGDLTMKSFPPTLVRMSMNR